MVVVIKNFEGTFPGGRIMTVRPSDPDATGRYQCRLLSGPDNIFTVEEEGCAVRAGRIQNGREYELRVSSNDGKHADVEVQARLNFVGFSQFAVQESVVIRFSGELQNLACGKSDNVANVIVWENFACILPKNITL